MPIFNSFNIPSACPPHLLALVCSLLLLLAMAPSSQAQIVDRMVAEVNGQGITLSQLEREMAGVSEEIRRQTQGAEQEQTLREVRRQVLNGMIDRLLVEQKARQRGVFVSDREVDQALSHLLAEQRLSLEEFKRELEKENSTLADYRRELRTQILQSRLLGLEIRERVVIPESRIKAYYQENYGGESRTEAYHILQIGLTWQEGDDEARARARSRAQALREQALAGGDFRELARRYSELPSRAGGGDLGVFERAELDGPMLKHIPALQPGEISPLIETRAGYQFFKLLSDQGDVRTQLSYAQARAEIREKLYNQALEEHFATWVNNLRENAYIRTML